MRDSVINEGISLEIALQVITSNPAQVLKLSQKDNLKPGCDADIVLLNQET
ncbi:amidohydrolase family protein [Gottfriedia sp. S16(2024)]|uniref:amidohydrolase family protein n=1 Tax=Gottfriedia sp. S16(2024) TaxID=3162883 RepID=UPI003D253950